MAWLCRPSVPEMSTAKNQIKNAKCIIKIATYSEFLLGLSDHQFHQKSQLHNLSLTAPKA